VEADIGWRVGESGDGVGEDLSTVDIGDQLGARGDQIGGAELSNCDVAVTVNDNRRGFPPAFSIRLVCPIVPTSH